jgi:hypothetical protein
MLLLFKFDSNFLAEIKLMIESGWFLDKYHQPNGETFIIEKFALPSRDRFYTPLPSVPIFGVT